MNYWKFAMVPALFAAALPLGAAEAADQAPISQAAEALFTINNICFVYYASWFANGNLTSAAYCTILILQPVMLTVLF